MIKTKNSKTQTTASPTNRVPILPSSIRKRYRGLEKGKCLERRKETARQKKENRTKRRR